jgi:hypothetical protein
MRGPDRVSKIQRKAKCDDDQSGIPKHLDIPRVFMTEQPSEPHILPDFGTEFLQRDRLNNRDLAHARPPLFQPLRTYRIGLERDWYASDLDAHALCFRGVEAVSFAIRLTSGFCHQTISLQQRCVWRIGR